MALTLMFIALVVLAGGTVGFAWWQMRKGLPLEAMPSLAWLLMVTLPFLGQWAFWQEPFAQAVGTFVIGASVLLGDFLAMKLMGGNPETQSSPPEIQAISQSQVRELLIALALVSLALALLHLYLMPRIPMLALLTGEESDSRRILQLREESAKLLHVPRVVKHMFNWLLTVFCAIGIITLLSSRRYLLAGTWYGLAFAYAVMTTAKVPAALLTFGIAGGILWWVGARARKRIYSLVLLALFLITAGSAVYIILSPTSRLSLVIRPERRQAIDWDQVLAPPDLWRVRFKKDAPASVNVLEGSQHPEEYILYRVFLAPVEVANYWYQFYSSPERREGWRAILPSHTPPGYVHPARKVGVWAYRKRFPHLYGPTTHAYASVDADAYAHFGFPGIFVSALLIFAFRVLVAYWGRGSELRRSISGVSVTLLAFLLPMGGVQAVFGAQGLFFYPGALLVAMWVEGKTRLAESA